MDYLEICRRIQTPPFDERPCHAATFQDLDIQAVRDFVRIARLESGNHDLTLGTLQRPVKALKVTVGKLVE